MIYKKKVSVTCTDALDGSYQVFFITGNSSKLQQNLWLKKKNSVVIKRTLRIRVIPILEGRQN